MALIKMADLHFASLHQQSTCRALPTIELLLPACASSCAQLTACEVGCGVYVYPP